MRPPISRIVIIGVTGAGKTTFALAVADIFHLPLYHMDSFIWENGWHATKDNDAIIRYSEDIMSRKEWILEGYLGYMDPADDIRLNDADLVIVLNYSRWRLAWHIIKRTFTHHGRHRKEMPAHCIEKIKPSLIKKIWSYLTVPDLDRHLHAWTKDIDQAKIIRFHSPSTAKAWLDSCC